MAKDTMPQSGRPRTRKSRPNGQGAADSDQQALYGARLYDENTLDEVTLDTIEHSPISATMTEVEATDPDVATSLQFDEPLAAIDPPIAAREMQPTRSPRPTLRQRMARLSWESWTYIAIFSIAAISRFWGLADKPLHHDESLHAYFSLQFLLNPSGYLYDPLLHGPFQFHIIPLFYILGHLVALGLAAIAALLFHLPLLQGPAGFFQNLAVSAGLNDGGANDFTVRLLPTLLGLAMVPMPFLIRDRIGRYGALAMSALFTVSPSFVYFSRFTRDDIYVTCFTLLMVAGALCYGRTRKLRWLLVVVASLVLSYTAMENTFFIIAIFGSFLLGAVLWDLGPALGRRLPRLFLERDQPLAGRILLLAPFLIVMGVAALIGLHKLSILSTTINTMAAAHSGAGDPLNPDNIVAGYEQKAVAILLVISIVIALLVIVRLLLQGMAVTETAFAEGTDLARSNLKRRSDPQSQPVWDALLGTHWIRWFMAFVLAWVIFAAFFWKLPANIFDLTEWGQGFQQGIGRGLLQGIYYWLEQQHVARGGQPWYYYAILLVMYEPLILVFGLAGIVRAILQPTRFRIFLVYWFATTLLLYSWAGEKMPWLVIHIVLPLIALARVAFEWIFATLLREGRAWWQPTRVLVVLGGVLVVAAIATTSVALTMGITIALSVAAIIALGGAGLLEQCARRRDVQHALGAEMAAAPRWAFPVRQYLAAGSLMLACALLIPTLWNTQRLVYDEPSVAPNEMLVYVQTTIDVQKVMDKINLLDQQLYHGQHKLTIGVTGEMAWPFAWYLHSYPNVYYQYSASQNGVQPDVIIADVDGASQNTTAVFGTLYSGKQYPLRWWWDESYKLPACSPTKTSQCDSKGPEWNTGVGPLEWITYGAYPPAACNDPSKAKCDPLNAPLNGALAAQRYWNWLWLRQNISGVQHPGSTDFVFFVHSNLLGVTQP